MQYIFVLEGSLSELARSQMSDTFRPRVGDEIILGNFPNETFKITRSIPPSNPDNADVTYVVEYLSDLLQIKTDNFEQSYLDNLKGGSDSYRFQKRYFS